MEPEGEFVDEGDLTAEEMAAMDQHIAALDKKPPQVYARGYELENDVVYTVIHRPNNVAESQRTVLVPNMTVGRNPSLVFPKLIEQGMSFSLIWARTSKVNFQGEDGKPQKYGKDTCLIIFEKATDAKEFAEKYKARGAVHLPSPTNKRY